MMALTHCAIAATIVSFTLFDTSPLVMGLAILGSQIPDVDTSTSLIGQICFPVSRLIEGRYPHRSITHSFLATAVITFLSFVICYQLSLSWKIAIALPLGHLIACFSDTFTKQGVQLLFPLPVWCVFGSNPKRRITTGSPAEYWVLAGAIALLILNYHLVNSGGLVQNASQQLGLRSGALDLYNKESASHHVWTNIDGTFAADSSDADGKYFILAVDGSEFIVTNGQGIYKTGEQIITEKLTAATGEKAKTEVKTIALSDDDVVNALQQLTQSYKDSIILLSGQIEVSFPDEMKVNFDAKEFVTLELSGKTAKLNYYPLAKAIADFKDQYATGNITAKIITPIPEFAL